MSTRTVCPDCNAVTHPIFLRIVHEKGCPQAKGDSSMNQYCPVCGGSEGEHHPWCDHHPQKGVKTPERKIMNEQEIVSFIQGGSPMSVDGLIMRAAKVAAMAHKDQVRQYVNVPYIHHPMRVAGRTMLLLGAGPIEIASAWLHDVIEDTALKAEELEKLGIPEAVVHNVLCLSNPSRFSKDKPREERKAMDRMFLAEQSPWVKKIKMIDRIDNLLDLSWDQPEFILLYSKESNLLAEAIGDVDLHLKEELLSITEYYETELKKLKETEPASP